MSEYTDPQDQPPQPSDLLRTMWDVRDAQRRLEEAKQCEASLSFFISKAWHVLKPMEQYKHGWHIDAMSEHLMAVTANEIKRLQIWVPPGTMKPVTVEALVLMGDGRRKRLGDVEVGDTVITHTGAARRVLAVHEQGVLPVVRVATDSGRVVHAAPDHPFLTANGWKNAGDLDGGDVLATVAGPRVEAVGRPHTAEEMRLIGYFIGDGNTTQNGSDIAANITCYDPVQGADIVACAEAMGFTARYATGQARRYNLSGGVRQWLRDTGLAGKSSHTKRVPIEIFSAPTAMIAQFIGAYFACDGTLASRSETRRDLSVVFNSVNRELLEDVQHLLLRLGVRSRIRAHISRRNNFIGGEHRSWRLVISSLDDTAKFVTRIPVIGVKAQRLAAMGGRRTRFDELLQPDPVTSVERDGESECRCLTVEEDGSFTANDLVVKNTMEVSVFWPAWEWTMFPWIRYWGASYEVRMAGRIAAMSRDLMMSAWYQARWEQMFKFTREGENYFGNSMGGTRLATAPESTGSGEHGHRILIDDPINAKSTEATSKVTLTETNNWYDTTVVTRGIGNEHARVIIMQRLHEEDLAAHVLESEEWEVLCLPERYEPKHPFVWPDDPRTEEGDLLWPDVRDEKASTALANSLTPHRAAGQLQQRPAAKEGDLLKVEWWRFYDPKIRRKEEWSQLPNFSMVVQTIDCPLKDKETNDNIAIQVWGIHGMHRYLLDLRLAKMSYPNAKRAVTEMAQWARRTWPRARHVVLVENGGYGADLHLDLKDKFTGFTKISPSQDGDKVVRADRASDSLQSGHCFLPGYGPPYRPPVYEAGDTAADINDFIASCARFPNATHDDDVDAWSQLINWLRGKQVQPVRTSSAAKRRRGTPRAVR